ncbi:retention module-containing protein, partial [Photobacterium kasasachensis]|uniref:retention module-containing protein n=1 Tax=Photobacterium kasasachensis TaxID=2910240 RepID=UPI003D101F44
MDTSNNSKVVDVKIANGVAFVIKGSDQVIAVKAEYQIQPDEIMVANPGTRYVVLVDGEPVVVQEPCPTCVAISDNGVKVAAMDNNVTFNPDYADQARFDNDELTAIQNAILAGEDPTSIFEATAAGSASSGASNQGFVVIDYDYDNVLAEAGFDTSFGTELDTDESEDESSLVQLTPVDINQAPVAQARVDSATEGSEIISGHVVANDPDGDSLTYQLVDQDVPAGLTFNADGSYTFDPSHDVYDSLAEGETVDVKVSYQVDDGRGGKDTQTLTITVVGTNDGAVVTPSTPDADAGTVKEDMTLTTGGKLDVADPDAGEATFEAKTVTDGNFGTFKIDSEGNWSYELNNGSAEVQALTEASEPLSREFTVTTADGTEHTVTVTIKGTGDAPEFISGFNDNHGLDTSGMTDADIYQFTVDENQLDAKVGLVGSYDPDAGDTVTYTLTNHNDLFEINATTGEIRLKDGVALDHEEAASYSLVVEVTDSEGLNDTAEVKVTVGDVNEASEVSGKTVGDVTEGNIGDAPETATGTIAISDVDNGDNPRFDNVDSTAGDNGYGSFSLVDGEWTYTLDQSKVQQLDEGDKVEDTITFTATDGTRQQVTVEITGTEDASQVSGTFTGAVTEGNIGDAPETATGTIAISDVDNGDNPRFDNVGSTAGDNGYGSFTLVDGEWTYTLDQSKVQQLDEGDKVEDTITFTATDGTRQQVTVEITGTEDASQVSGTFTGAVTEGNIGDAPETATGTIAISDVDNGDNPRFADVTSTEGDNGYGSFTLVDGKWTYILDQSKVQQLDEGDKVEDTITFTATDGTRQQVTVEITGTEDASQVSGTFTGAVTEGNIGDSPETATGTIAISDVDNGDNPRFDNVDSTAGDNGYGSFTLVDGEWTYTLDQSKVQQLDEGDKVSDTITFTATDGTRQQVTVEITGTEDASQVSGTSSGAFTEGNIGDATETATGTIAISDVDDGDNPRFADVTSTEGDNGYGSFTLVDGEWTYTLNQSKVQQLDEGDKVSDTITFTATDGTRQQVTVEITGTEDASQVSGTFTGAVTEGNIGDAPERATGTIAISDVDNGDNPRFADVTSTEGDSGYGSFTLVDGEWTYTLDQSKVQQLDEGDKVSDTITFTATDGTRQQVTVEITGTEDASQVSGTFTGAVTEGNIGDAPETATGTIAISDVDNGDNPRFDNVDSTAGDNGYGSFTLVDGEWTYTLDQSKVQQLDEGDKVSDTITFTATDGTRQQVTVEITGTEDASQVSGTFTGAVTEGNIG